VCDECLVAQIYEWKKGKKRQKCLGVEMERKKGNSCIHELKWRELEGKTEK